MIETMMKRLFTIPLTAMLALATTQATDVTTYTPGEGEGIVYFLPKTALEINVVATKVSYSPGELCQYANRYLKQNNVSSKPGIFWELKQIDIRPAGIPDSTKAYIIKLKDKSAASHVELTEEGIVKAINTMSTFPSDKFSCTLEKPGIHENARQYMTEEILQAGSTAKLADLTAKEIYNIRESKNLILRGQADTMPKDGASLKLIIENLDKQEKALTELFTGIKDREDKLFTFYIPANEELSHQIALRFSNQLGVLTPDNLAGEPVYISLKNISPIPASTEETDEKKKKRAEGIIYNIPGKGLVTASFQGKKFFEQEISVTQFGGTETLVDELFSKKINTKVIFNPTTGGIAKIQKD